MAINWGVVLLLAASAVVGLLLGLLAEHLKDDDDNPIDGMCM